MLDHRGNGDGIGAKVLIKGAFGQQLRELKTSGGFSSFDAPIAWFGVGSNGLVDSAEVRWLNGGVTTLKGPLEAGHIYRVTRR